MVEDRGNGNSNSRCFLLFLSRILLQDVSSTCKDPKGEKEEKRQPFEDMFRSLVKLLTLEENWDFGATYCQGSNFWALAWLLI